MEFEPSRLIAMLLFTALSIPMILLATSPTMAQAWHNPCPPPGCLRTEWLEYDSLVLLLQGRRIGLLVGHGLLSTYMAFATEPREQVIVWLAGGGFGAWLIHYCTFHREILAGYHPGGIRGAGYGRKKPPRTGGGSE